MSRGVDWRRWLDPIDDFVRSSAGGAPRWAVFCTYGVDLHLLDTRVLHALSRRGRQFRTVVLADARELEKELGRGGRGASPEANVHPVRVRGGVFHPKLLLLRAGPRARVCFGSANLTSGGLGGNLELWAHSDDEDVVAGVVAFFSALQSNAAVTLDPAAKRAVARALAGLPGPHESERVWTSLAGPFVDRLSKAPRGARIDIISPAYATGGLEGLWKRVERSRVTVHTDARLAIKGVAQRGFRPDKLSEADADDGDDPARPRTLHAKGYLVRSARPHLWMGSANLTSKALCRRVGGGGNVEILVKMPLSTADANAFVADLGRWFGTTPAELRPRQHDGDVEAQGSVLAAEASPRRDGWRLTMHLVSPAAGLDIRLHGKKYQPKVRGLTATLDVPGPMPEARMFTAFEITGGGDVPFVVNAPHVPGDDAMSTVDDVLASWTDDLLGRVVVAGPAAREAADDDGDDEPDAQREEEEELRRRLDAAEHQGAIDKIAVHLAVLKRAIERSRGRRAYRAQLGEALLASLARAPASDAHLVGAIEQWVRSTIGGPR